MPLPLPPFLRQEVCAACPHLSSIASPFPEVQLCNLCSSRAPASWKAPASPECSLNHCSPWPCPLCRGYQPGLLPGSPQQPRHCRGWCRSWLMLGVLVCAQLLLPLLLSHLVSLSNADREASGVKPILVIYPAWPLPIPNGEGVEV